MARIPKYIENLISGGESQTLDFKFEISSAKKIAKTLVAFANTDGGKLLVGVKDNGVIAGIRTDEEVFMIDSAAKMYSKPKIEYDIEAWNINGKQILEVKVNHGQQKPYFAQEKNGKWKSYIRVNDQNFIANNVITRFWKEKAVRQVELEYNREVEFILSYLNDYPSITLNEFCNRAQITPKSAEDVLVDLLILDILKFKVNDSEVYYQLSTLNM